MQDSTGEPIETWAAQRETRAHRRDLQGNERLRSNQELAERVSVFTIRWFQELTAGDWRISHEVTTDQNGNLIPLKWDIQGIAEPPDTRRQWWEITATAVRV